MQGWTTTPRNGVTRKRITKRLTHIGNRFRKSIQLKCLLIIDLKPFRSYVKRKHFIGRELQSLAARGNKFLT